jgi:UDP-3-O-[3-hydroxymyristoyl] glucosamine N-acyltransferase
MEFTVQQIAEVLQGEVKGDASQKIYQVGKIQEAKPGEIAFLSNMKYENYAYTTQASALIVNRDFQPRRPITTTLILVENAYTAITTLLEQYQKLTKKNKRGIETPSYISPTAKYGENIYLGAFAYLGDHVQVGQNVQIYPQAYIGDHVRIGDGTTIYAGAKVYAGSVIGRNCIIHAGAVIGSDGFGFAPQTDGTYRAIPQLGHVVLEDQVEIGANTTIDRATMGATHVGEGVKLDNLVQVGHNVKLGKNTVIAALTGISGSSELGENCIVGGQVGISGHLQIAPRTSIGPQAGIMKTIKEEGTALVGSPAFDVKEYFKAYAVFRKMPSLIRQLENLVKESDAEKSNA